MHVIKACQLFFGNICVDNDNVTLKYFYKNVTGVNYTRVFLATVNETG